MPLAVNVKELTETQKSIPTFNQEIGQLSSLIDQYTEKLNHLHQDLQATSKNFLNGLQAHRIG